MKTLKLIAVVCFLMITNILVAQQKDNMSDNDSTGLPGDDFSLQGALEMFKNAKSLEDFEQKLNTESNYVNNLDLNSDGNIDYVKVIDKTDGKVHAIVLQVPVNDSEEQDVAVIEIEKNDNESAMLQIIGDEELYGDSTIVEPFDVSEGKTDANGPAPGIGELKVVIVNVWMWPCVKYIYAPTYVVWVSPWKYHYYPPWFQPWKPAPWYIHHNHCHHYHYGYHPVYIHRVYVAHNYYQPYRKTSVVIVNKYKPAHIKYKENHPYKTYNSKNNNQPPKNNKNTKNNPSNNKNNNNVKKNNAPKQDNNKNVNKNNTPNSNNKKSSNKGNGSKTNKGGGKTGKK